MGAIEAAGRRGSTAEDLTEGHSLMADPDSRELQQSFVAWTRRASGSAAQSCCATRGEDDQRAMAATIIGYAPDKTKVVGRPGVRHAGSGRIGARQRYARAYGDRGAGHARSRTWRSISPPHGSSRC